MFCSFGFDPSTLSPPTHDDDFMHIRRPKPVAQQAEPSANFTSLSELLEVKQEAFSKHTKPCKKFIPNIQDSMQTANVKVIRPKGVDDGFKGEGAACGASVVAVASQMIAGAPKNIFRGYTTDDAAADAPPPSYLRQRRNSKSLPASPLATPESSPTARRKNNTPFGLQNRFFTGPFIATEKTLNESEEHLERKSGSSWLLSGLFSHPGEAKEQSIVAAGDIHQVSKKDTSEKSTETVATETVNVTVEVKTTAATSSAFERTFFRAKPSELREMNFWSPTSM